MLLVSKAVLAWLALVTAVLLPAATLASTVTIASPIATDVNPPIDLTVYGNNTSVFLNGTYTVYWNAHLNATPPYLELALDVKTSGWFGFGFADPASGGMKGSDIATITVIPNATHYVTSITDRYAVAHALPSEDDVNNFNLTAGWQAPDKSHTIVVFTRALDTSDPQDRVISGGSVSVVMAYSSDGSTNVAYHGPNKHAYTIQFFPDPSAPPPTTGEVIMTWNYTNPATSITTAETRYVCTSFIFDPPKLANGSDARGQIVRISPVIDPNTVAWVHHYVVYGCANTTKFNQYLGKPTECLTNDNGLGDSCPQVVFAWAVGSGSLDFPPDVGASFGDPTDPETIKYLAIQVHYNNPSLQPVNITDQSGLSFDYITTQRKYNSGSIQLGDPTIQASPMKFGSSNFAYEFTCPSECTSMWPGDITIFVSMLHAHSYGTQLLSTVTSKGVTTDLNRADYYEYAFQHIAPVNHTIKKGDQINVHCVFDVSQNIFSNDPLHANDTQVQFGLSSENEMCLNYVFYYPRFPLASQYGFCGNGGSDTTLCGYNDKGVIRLEIANPVQPNSSYADPNWVLTKRFGLNKTGEAALNATIAANPGPTNSTSSTSSTTTTTTSGASSNFRAGAGTILAAVVGWALVVGLM